MILIIGSHGFLGSMLSKSFIKKKYLIRKIDKNSKSISEKIDIRDYDALEKIFKKNKFKFVINCACEPATTRGKKKIFSTNFLGNKNLISLCEKYNIKKYIFFSTSAIWAKNYFKPVKESTPVNPIEYYGLSKVLAEKSILKSNLNNWTIFRVPMIVSSSRLGVLSILFDFILNNKKIPLLGNGENRLQFLHIDDLFKYIEKSLTIKEKEIYNLASNQTITFRNLILELIRSVSSKSKIIFIKDIGFTFVLKILNKIGLSPLNIYHLTMLKSSLTLDCSKIKKNYKFDPDIKTADMIKEALMGYKNKSFTNVKTQITSPLKMGILKIIYSFF